MCEVSEAEWEALVVLYSSSGESDMLRSRSRLVVDVDVDVDFMCVGSVV